MLSALMGPPAVWSIDWVGMDILGCSAEAHRLCSKILEQESVSRAVHRESTVRFYLNQSKGTELRWV